MEKKKRKKFKLFDLNRDGKGVEKEDRKPTFLFFFKLLLRKFSSLLRLNVLMIFQVVPMLVWAFAYFLGEKTPLTTNYLFAPLYGINQISVTPGAAPLLDLSSIQMGTPTFSTAIQIVLVVLFLILAVTWGWQNVGATYVLRGLVRGDAVFVFSDFFYAIKKNFKQGFLLGLIDFIICALLVVDITYCWFWQPPESFFSYFLAFAVVALSIIYFIMRFYIYLLLITFDIKIFKLIKNAFIFSVLGIWRNVLAFGGILIFVLIHAAAAIYLSAFNFSLPILLPFIYAMPVTAFMAAYAAYPIIDKYMISPYAKEKDEEEFIYFKESNENE